MLRVVDVAERASERAVHRLHALGERTREVDPRRSASGLPTTLGGTAPTDRSDAGSVDRPRTSMTRGIVCAGHARLAGALRAIPGCGGSDRHLAATWPRGTSRSPPAEAPATWAGFRPRGVPAGAIARSGDVLHVTSRPHRRGPGAAAPGPASLGYGRAGSGRPRQAGRIVLRGLEAPRGRMPGLRGRQGRRGPGGIRRGSRSRMPSPSAGMPCPSSAARWCRPRRASSPSIQGAGRA